MDCKIKFTDYGYNNYEYQNLYFKWYYDAEGKVYKLSNQERTPYMRLTGHKPQQCQGIIPAYKIDYEYLKTRAYKVEECLEGDTYGETYYVILKKIPIRFIETQQSRQTFSSYDPEFDKQVCNYFQQKRLESETSCKRCRNEGRVFNKDPMLSDHNCWKYS